MKFPKTSLVVRFFAANTSPKLISFSAVVHPPSSVCDERISKRVSVSSPPEKISNNANAFSNALVVVDKVRSASF